MPAFEFLPSGPERIVCTVNKDTFSPLRLAVLLTERELYRAREDSVHVLFVDLTAAGMTEQLTLFLNRMEFQRLPVTLDEFGMGTVVVPDLPAGDYSVRCGPLEARFRVAEYTLPGLLAQLLKTDRHGDNLDVQLSLTRYGRPVTGPVRVELCHGTSVLDEETGLACAGKLEVRFRPQAQGSHHLQLQLLHEPSATATVNLSGTSSKDRSAVTYSWFDPKITGTLVPDSVRDSSRGVYQEEQSHPASPVQCRQLPDGAVELTLRREVEEMLLVRFDAARPEQPQQDRYQSLPAGKSIRIVPDAPLSWLLCALVDREGHSWQGHAAVIVPSAMKPWWELPEPVPPGQEVELRLRGGPARGSAFVVVRDARGTRATSLEREMAGCLQAHVKTNTAALRPLPRVARGQSRAPADILELLQSQGFVDGAAVDELRRQGLYTGASLEPLIRAGVLDAEVYGRVLADSLGLAFVEEARLLTEPENYRLIPEYLARRYRCLPLGAVDNLLTLAMVDPLDVFALDDIRLITGFEVKAVLATEEGLRRAIQVAYGVEDIASLAGAMHDRNEKFEPDEAPQETSLSAQAVPVPRSPEQFSDLLYAGVLPLQNGELVVRLDAGRGEFRVEAALVGQGDWAQADALWVNRGALEVALEVPSHLGEGEVAEGRVVAVCGEGTLRLTGDGKTLATQAMSAGQELLFRVQPGDYEAELVSPTGQRHSARATVPVPGRQRQVTRSVRSLAAGSRLQRGGEILEFRLLPNLKLPLQKVASGLVSFEHGCSEQTAAKMIGVMLQHRWSDSADSAATERLLAAGLQRMESMVVPGRGFSSYPGHSQIEQYWGKKATLHLLQLSLLRNGLESPALSETLEAVRKLALQAAEDYDLEWPPEQPEHGEEAYALMQTGNPDAALQWARQRCEISDGAVHRRTEQAYAATILLQHGTESEREQAQQQANALLAEVGISGMWYSTVDSVAMAALLGALSRASNPGLVTIDGVNLPYPEALSRCDCRSLEVPEGTVPVEVLCVREETDVPGDVRVTVRLEPSRPMPGQPVTLSCWHPTYKAGDLLWLDLPPCLSRLHGGGQVRRFSVDFEGRQHLRIPLAVTGNTPEGAQTLRTRVRNMFEEERASIPHALPVEIAPAPPVPAGRYLARVDFTWPAAARRLRSEAFEATTELMTEALFARLQDGSHRLRGEPQANGNVRWRLHDSQWEVKPDVAERLLYRLLGEAGIAAYPPRPHLVNLEHRGNSFVLAILPTSWGTRFCLRRGSVKPSPNLPIDELPPPRERDEPGSGEDDVAPDPLIRRLMATLLSRAADEGATGIRLESRSQELTVHFRDSAEEGWTEKLVLPGHVTAPLFGAYRECARRMPGNRFPFEGRSYELSSGPGFLQLDARPLVEFQPAVHLRPGVYRVAERDCPEPPSEDAEGMLLVGDGPDFVPALLRAEGPLPALLRELETRLVVVQSGGKPGSGWEGPWTTWLLWKTEQERERLAGLPDLYSPEMRAESESG